MNTRVPDALPPTIALELDQAAMRMARALKAFTVLDQLATGCGGRLRSPSLLRELAAALDDYLIQMHRSMGIGERALDTVFYFGTPSLDQLTSLDQLRR